MFPSAPHAAPAVTGGTWEIRIGAPPASGTFFNSVVVKKPSHSPSGEKNGANPPSVPAIGSAADASSARRYNRTTPRLAARKTTVRPSGETAIAGRLAKLNSVSAGSGRTARTGFDGAATGRPNSRPAE